MGPYHMPKLTRKLGSQHPDLERAIFVPRQRVRGLTWLYPKGIMIVLFCSVESPIGLSQCSTVRLDETSPFNPIQKTMASSLG